MHMYGARTAGRYSPDWLLRWGQIVSLLGLPRGHTRVEHMLDVAFLQPAVVKPCGEGETDAIRELAPGQI